MKLNKPISIKSFLGYFFLFFITFLFFLAIQTAGKTLNCPDSFYHAKMVSFLSQGKIIKNFVWLPYTILGENYIDHHFLYHILVIPFSLIFSPLFGIKMATLFFATLAIIIFYWFLKKFKIKIPLVWTLLLFTSSTFLTRLNLAKVPATALIVLIFGLYTLFKRKHFLLGLISFIYVWLYNTWPILYVTVILYCLSYAFKKIINHWNSFKDWKLKIKNFLKYLFEKENLKIFFSSFFGIVLGLIINPYFPKNLYFDWVHIIKIGLKNYQNILSVGAEWHPYDPLDLIFGNLFIFIPWLISIGWFFVSFKKSSLPFSGQRTKTLTLFIISSLFFIYTIKSRRNIEYFVPLAILFTSFSFNHLFSNFSWHTYLNEFKKMKEFPFNLISLILICLFSTFFIFSGLFLYERVWLGKIKEFSGGLSFDKFKKLSLFLKENTQEGEIIFHSSWDEFPMLFYHNDKNYYIAGLDPTFFYEKSKPLYWLWFNIITGKQKKNLAKTIKENFKARYIFVRSDHKMMNKNFEEDKDFEKIYEDDDGYLYKLKEK